MQRRRSAGTRSCMTDDTHARLLAAVQRAPAWLRAEFASKDEAVRIRAEEALAAMLDNALKAGDQVSNETVSA